MSSTIAVGEVDVPLLGEVCWWNCQGIELTQEMLANVLHQCGFSDRYAREHNYRSAFIRTLRRMEEKRIIRLVKESLKYLIYQFTAEQLQDQDEDTAHLEYRQETVVVVNKETYRETGDFASALVKGDPGIRQRIIDFFEVEKKKYNSSDISRYVQKIFRTEADIITLRSQGSVYFVPATYRHVVQKVERLAQMIEGLTFNSMVIVDVDSTRQLVREAAIHEFDDLLRKMDKAFARQESLTEKALDHKQQQLEQLQRRVEEYSKMLDADISKEIKDRFSKMEQRIIGSRSLDL